MTRAVQFVAVAIATVVVLVFAALRALADGEMQQARWEMDQ